MNMARLAIYLIITFIFLTIDKVQSRLLGGFNSSDKLLLSDGVEHEQDQSPFIRLYDDASLSSSSNECVHLYGFFPCAENVEGFILLIVVYQYLMIVAEKLVAKGSATLFNIVGTGIYGATAFRIFKVLPALAMMIVSGIFASTEDAQNQVSVGVSVFAGSTIFNLTLLWGMCVIFGTKIHEASSTSQSLDSKRLLSSGRLFCHLNDTGMTTDKRTRYTAGIMLLSLIPFLLVQLVNVFNTSSGIRTMVLIALIVSITLLITYFIIQIKFRWIQDRSLEYSKYENLLAGFLHHVERHAEGKLIDENGLPNVQVIKRLFNKTDSDGDKSLTREELEDMFIDIIQSGEVNIDTDLAVREAVKAFDSNGDKEINEQEFIKGCIKWIYEAKNLSETSGYRARQIWDKVVQKFTAKKKNEITKIEQLMERILKQFESQALKAKGLINDDGTPNKEHIRALFKKLDTNEDQVISEAELEQSVRKIKFEDELNYDEMVKKVMEDFDEDGNNKIDEEEFVRGVTKWVNEAIRYTNRVDRRAIDKYDKTMWEKADELIYEIKDIARITWIFIKSILQVISGIVILTFLSRPFVMSILQLSNAFGIQSLVLWYVIVPVVMNARKAKSAIFPAKQKTERTASLTFSEIYGEVIMNNIAGLVTLLTIVYAKDLTWNYSAEVLIILVVCGAVGFFAFSQTTYPPWTSLFAFFLYAFSVVLFYVLQHIWGWN